MNEEQKTENELEFITARQLLSVIKPMIKDEFIAQCREDRAGIKIKFTNGQQFLFTVTEIK